MTNSMVKGREISHGHLVMRALENMMPGARISLYCLRVTSDFLGSCESSSQAEICAESLAMMDAGVPKKKMVARSSPLPW